MVVDDVKSLIKKYISIVDFLNQIDGGIPPPTIYVMRCGIRIDLYNKDNHRDPWKTLVDIELQCGTKLDIKDLAVFNVLNIGFWKGPSYSKSTKIGVDEVIGIDEVFQLSTLDIRDSISYEMFLACCIALDESRRNRDLIEQLDSERTRNYAIKLIALIDKLEPLFIAKLFTEDTKRFMSCIEFSGSIELPTFIMKSFAQKIHLNEAMFKTILSIFKQEMTKQRTNSMFMH